MAGDPADLDPRELWRSQEKEHDPMTLAAIHAKARTFESRIERRNAIEYVASGVVIVCFAPILLQGPNWIMQLGAGLVMLGAVVVAWQLHRRASNESTPLAGEALVDAYRRQLIRQRDALRTVWLWYLGPLAPGLAAMMIGGWFRRPPPRMTVEQSHVAQLATDAFIILVFLGVFLLNLWGARRLQKRIDEL